MLQYKLYQLTVEVSVLVVPVTKLPNPRGSNRDQLFSAHFAPDSRVPTPGASTLSTYKVTLILNSHASWKNEMNETSKLALPFLVGTPIEPYNL